MSLRESIEEIVQNFIKDEYFIIEVSVSGAASHHKVTVLLDGDRGITIDKCAEVSRVLGGEIEKRELITQNYILEVSSPGVDYPLKSPRQYLKNLGRKLRILMEEDAAKEGILKDVTADGILIEEEVKAIDKTGKALKNRKTLQIVEIPFNRIKKTNVIISFN